MRYLSLFSGIEAASVAFQPLGWTCVGFSEIEPFPCALLAHRYPDVPNLGDVSRITHEQIDDLGPIDLVVGGFPCTDLSVAGKRAGLNREDGSATRSGLFWDAMRVANWTNARYVVIENVPGLFSCSDGRDFAAVAGALAGCQFDVPPDGWASAGAAAGPSGCVEWRTLDAQYVRVESHPRAVPQRRRRVFIVRHSGDWARSAPVLLERESLLGHPAPRRSAGEGTARSTAPSLTGSGRGVERAGETRGQDPVIAVPSYSPCLNAGGMGRSDSETETLIPTVTHTLDTWSAGRTTEDGTGRGCPLTVTHALRADGFDASEDGTGRGTPLVPTIAPCLTGNYGKQPDSSDTSAGPMLVPIAFDARQSDVLQYGEKNGPLDTDGHTMAVAQCSNIGQMAVRRLLPVECEKLQGFPPGWTDIPYKGKRAADGPRYRALGNSFAVNCIRWVGQRIAAHKENSQ